MCASFSSITQQAISFIHLLPLYHEGHYSACWYWLGFPLTSVAKVVIPLDVNHLGCSATEVSFLPGQ
jgi:putative hemolysin